MTSKKNSTRKVKTLSVKCPQCNDITRWKDNPSRPFCSERCRLIDLGAWAEERYSVPDSENPISEETDQE